MQCLLFFVRLNEEKNYVSYIKPEKHKNKRISTQRHNNPSLLKGFKRFLIGGSSGSPLKVEHLDVLWFATTQP